MNMFPNEHERFLASKRLTRAFLAWEIDNQLIDILGQTKTNEPTTKKEIAKNIQNEQGQLQHANGS